MLPKVNIFLKKNIENGTFPDTGKALSREFVLLYFLKAFSSCFILFSIHFKHVSGLHMADVFVLCGFFLVYFCEEITHLMIERHVKPRKLPEGKPLHSFYII